MLVSRPSTPDSAPSLVEVLDEETVLSRPARTPLGTPPFTTMSWIGQSSAATGSPMGEPGEAGDELPPEYSVVRAPTTRMEYTFSPNGFSSMLVLPPSDAPDTRPIYHISIALDPFIPTAGATTVCRGGHADNEFVGEFEWGLTRAIPTITMGSRQVEARAAMKQTSSTSKSTTFTWHWNDGRALQWVAEDNLATCYAYNGRDRPNIATDVLAIFTGRRLHPRADKRRQPPRALQVFPRAHEGRLLDYIVMGVLMLERKRLAPWGDREGHFELKGNIHATPAGVR